MTTYDKSPKFLTHSYPQENTLYLPSGAVARLGKGCAFAVRFSPDGNLIAVRSSIGVWLYDAHTYVFVSLLAFEDTGVISSFAFSPDSLLLATGDWDGYIKLWSVDTSENIATIKGHTPKAYTGHVYDLVFSADNMYLASTSLDQVKLWVVERSENIATIKEHTEPSGHTDRVETVVFSPDSRLLATGSWDKTVKLWAVETGENIATLSGHKGQVNSVAFSPDGRYVVSGSGDDTAKLWGVDTLENIATLSGHKGRVTSVAFSPDDRYVVSGISDNTIKLWEVNTGENIATLYGHTNGVYSVVFSPDGTRLASGGWWPDQTVRLWDVGTGKNIVTLSGHKSDVQSIAFSPSGCLIASGGFDSVIFLWDATLYL